MTRPGLTRVRWLALLAPIAFGVFLIAGRGSRPGIILRGQGVFIGNAHFSPDASLAAGLNENGAFELWETATGKRRFVLPSVTKPEPNASFLRAPNWLPSRPDLIVRFSHDGRRLAIGEGGRVKLWDASTGGPLGEFEGEDFAFPPGPGPFVVRMGGRIFTRDESTGEPKAEFGFSAEPSLCRMRFTDDGRTLAVAAVFAEAGEALDLRTFETKGWSMQSAATIQVARASPVELGPNGDLFLMDVTKGIAELVRYDARAQKTGSWPVAAIEADASAGDPEIPARASFAGEVAAAGGGMVLVSANDEAGSPDLWLVDTRTASGQSRPITEDQVPGTQAILTPDGETLIEFESAPPPRPSPGRSLSRSARLAASMEARHRLVFKDARTGVVKARRSGAGYIESLRIAPDGSMLAIKLSDGAIHLWDMP